MHPGTKAPSLLELMRMTREALEVESELAREHVAWGLEQRKIEQGKIEEGIK